MNNNKIIAFLGDEGVEELEYHVPAMRLQEAGYKVVLTSLKGEVFKGKNGLVIHPDTKVDTLQADELFGLVLPGGWSPDKMRRSKKVTDLIAEVHKQGKVIGIICHGGLLAISAGIVNGPATGSLGIKDDVVNAGGTWVDEPAFTDGNLVWGRVVADIPDFNRELIAALEASE
jgi:protease I